MNLDKLNRWMTLVANLGVLIGIAALAYQITQTNLAMKAQMAQSRADTAINVAIARISTPGFAEASLPRTRLLSVRETSAGLDSILS